VTRRTPLELDLEAERQRLVARLTEIHLDLAAERADRRARKATRSISVRPETHAALQAEAERRGVSMRALVDEVIETALDEAQH
jgi:predicted HicB family RNase H-like nuclease